MVLPRGLFAEEMECTWAFFFFFNYIFALFYILDDICHRLFIGPEVEYCDNLLCNKVPEGYVDLCLSSSRVLRPLGRLLVDISA